MHVSKKYFESINVGVCVFLFVLNFTRDKNFKLHKSKE